MLITTTIAQWCRQSNRRLVLEAIGRLSPWLVASALIIASAASAVHTWIVIGIGVVVVGGVVACAAAWLRARWQRPASLASSLDRAHGTVDLLQSAIELEHAPAYDDP